jgi:FAD:protein FMN transferase
MLYELKDVRTALGTFVTITVIHPDVKAGAEALRLAFNEIFRIQALMSVHDPDSEISQLNSRGSLENVSQDTRQVIRRSQYFSELSKGAFDITVLPVLDLWEEKHRQNAVPSEEEIAEKQKLVGYENTVMEGSRIRFTRAGMKITLAGAAKGYAVDKAVEILKIQGIKSALVNAGGDIRCIGSKTEKLPWKIAVRDPQDKRRVKTVLKISNRAIATSGTYQRSCKDILDPRSGRPVEGDIISASVLAETALDADILTKCLYVPGLTGAQEMLSKLSAVEAVIITRDGKIVKLPEIQPVEL